MKKTLLILVLLCVSCTSQQKKQPSALIEEESPAQRKFDQGMKALEAERYQDAADIFDALLLEKPGTEMDLVAMFNSAASYEGLGNCKKASERYRQVIRASAKKFQRIESEALFHLSLMYECLGQDAKAITSLVDARNRGKELSFEVLNAEIPARLAAAYARLNNRQKALEYFNQAGQGLKAVVSKGTGRGPMENVARTLFLMGKLSPSQRRAEVDPTTYLQSLSMQQPYLLQAVEMRRQPWSNKAEADLKLAYENIWMFKISDNDKEHQFYTRALQTINELRNLRMPNSDLGVESIFASIDQTERKLRNELSRVPERNKLTQEAQKREGLKQTGRLVDPKKQKKQNQ